MEVFILHCDNRFDCALFMVFSDCRGCNDGYTRHHHDNDYDFNNIDFVD